MRMKFVESGICDTIFNFKSVGMEKSQVTFVKKFSF